MWSWLFFLLVGCKKTPQTLFTLLPPDKTHVTFNNKIDETDSFNILTDEYIYNGGGVGVGDFNRDGLEDLYFTGNLVPNKLYLNKGNFKFEDITDQAGVAAPDIWSSGVAVVDINNDGWPDIYVSATFNKKDGTRKNKLYINQGLTNGIPTFIDEAHKYGIDDDGYTTQSVFFDYDLDGDLDLYMLDNVFLGKRSMANENSHFGNKTLTVDKLYRNNGNGTFTDVSKEAGINLEGFGLGIAVIDVNKDGYPDLYISNDFVSSDVLYVNNGNGTFTNELPKYFKHVSYASMGNDASDINNDGLVDIMTLEMQPSNIQWKRMMYTNTVFNRDNLIMDAGYYKQYLRNCLQLNNGNGTFSDISYVLGISSTDWSWSTLFADFDNDGYKDLAIANGFPRNVTDKDYADRLYKMVGISSNPELLLPYIPRYKTRNFFFRSLKSKKFEDESQKWGINEDSYSNGAVFVDLNNDGALDYVTNNINQPAYIFKNNLNKLEPAKKWIRIKLSGGPENRDGFGAKISVFTDGCLQYYEHSTVRGYISSVDPVIHFGLDTCSYIDSLKIVWPGGKEQWLYKLPTNREITLDIKNARNPVMVPPIQPEVLFHDITSRLHLKYKDKESNFMDYSIQPLLPHMLSRLGPGLAVGDVNGDHLDDIVVGNGRGGQMEVLLQQPGGGFREIPIRDTADCEVTGVLLFDADNDGDLDLFAVSGSSEFSPHSYHFRDRLFINDGKGNFKSDPSALPPNFISGSVVTACDYDRDGDMDLFIGGRVIPRSYPMPERSILLQNNHGKFTDVTNSACSEFMNLGMVTTALWTDYDHDGWVDLLVAGEWMPLKIFKNDHGTFRDVSGQLGLKDTEGWWNSITAVDFNKSGNIDYVLGNEGLNDRYTATLEKPLYIIAKDFDNNGIVDPVMSAWTDGNYYPVPWRNDLIRQIPFMSKRFPKYIDYSTVTTAELFTPEELQGSIKLKATMFESSLLRKNKDGKFAISSLPFQAQFAPVRGIISSDFNHDDNPDLLMIGNNFNTEAFTGSQDAFIGLFLRGNDDGDLSPVPVTQSGFFDDGDGRALVSLLDKNNNSLIFAAQNDDSLKVFEIPNPGDQWVRFSPENNDRLVKIYYNNGKVQWHELYYGSSYLSCTGRDFLVDKRHVTKLEVTDYQDHSRIIPVSDLKN